MPRLLGLFVFLLAIWACSDSASVKKDDLTGRWEVLEAKRNGKLTRTFSNAYFEFGPNEELSTNFSGELITAPFSLEEMDIVQEGDVPVRYSIVEWADSSFIMSFNLHDFRFEFLLARQKDNDN